MNVGEYGVVENVHTVRTSPIRKYDPVLKLNWSGPSHMTYFLTGIINLINVNIWTLLDYWSQYLLGCRLF